MAYANQIAAKLARGEALTRVQREDLADFLGVSETVLGWVKTGASYPSFSFFEAERADFSFMPNKGARFRRAGSQSIPHDSGTNILFEEAQSAMLESDLSLDEDNNDRILIAGGDPDRLYIYGGIIDFDLNVSGWRGAFAVQRDKDGNNIGGATLGQVDAPVNVALTLSFMRPHKIAEDTAYITFHVHQTSGAALNINFVSIGIFRVY